MRVLLIFFGVLFLTLIFVFFSIGMGVAESSHNVSSGIFLEKGKNEAVFENAFFVKELVVLNPEIEYVNYYDGFLGKQVAYVNYLGGLGENFLIEPGRVYEISVSKNIELVLR